MAPKIYNLFVILCFYFKSCLTEDVTYRIDNTEQQQKQYCSFFNNRAPSAQPGLKNCTWFKETSCCLQQEIEATFVEVKPLKGASLSCQKYINYLMCYICAPNQNIFYQNERLTVCEDFCNRFYEACNTAILKGSPIKHLYSKGSDFCLSRRFLVDSVNCFNFDTSLDTSKSIKNHANIYLICILLLFAYILPRTVFLETKVGIHKLASVPNECSEISKSNEGTIISKHKNCNNMLPSASIFFINILLKLFYTYSVFWIMFMLFPSVYTKEDVMKLKAENVKNWAGILSNDLTLLAKEGLQYEELNSIMQSAEYNIEHINSTEKILEIKNKIVTFFTDKQKIAQDIAKKVQELHDDWQSMYSNVTSLAQLPDSVYKDTDLLQRLPLKHFTYDKRYGSSVLLNSSVVKLPDSVNRNAHQLVDVVQWTAELDLTFIRNMEQDKDIRWQYFGSSTGVHRTFPGREWSRNFIGFTDDFDPRSRPWYLSAVSGPKDVVIVIDASTSMATNNRLFRMKEVVKWILDTLTKQDRINIILSRSTYWKRKGGKRKFQPEIVSCEKSGLIQATASNRRELWSAVQSVTAKGGSDHLDAFKMAFDLLKNDSDVGHVPCQRLVLFLTDADIRDGDNRCTRGFYKYYHDGTKEYVPGKLCEYEHQDLHKQVLPLQQMLPYKASIVTFQLDDRSSPRISPSPGRLACNHNGVMVKVTEDNRVFESMKPYFDFLQQTSGAYDSLWTSPYLDKSGLGLMMTVSVPVYSKISKNLLGVVGVDVPLEKIETILRHSVWGQAYAFMVDRNDLAAIIHPFAKPTTQLLSDPIFAPVSDLEMHDGKPGDFVSVLSGILEAKTGSVMVTKDAIRPVSNEESLWWKKVEYTHYVYTNIPDSDFSIVLNVGHSDESGFHHKSEPQVPDSYLSDMEQYEVLGMAAEYKQLNLTNTHRMYPDISVSTTHSVVKLGPRAFCDPEKYLNGQPQFKDIHEYINTFGSGSSVKCSEDGVYKPDVRPEIKLTAQVEPAWVNRDPALQSQVLWTYIGTASGVIRIYPGVRIRQDYDPTSRIWYTRSSVNHRLDLSVSKVYTDAIPILGKVVTLSKSLQRPSPAVKQEECQVLLKPHGCSCTEDTDCHSQHCFNNICASDAIQAVVAMDIKYNDLHRRVLKLRNRVTEGRGKFCGSEYKCKDAVHLCKTRCYLITDTGHFSYADDFPNITQVYDSATLASVHGFIFKKLVEEKVFIRNYRLDYQGVCDIIDDDRKVNPFRERSMYHTEYPSKSGPIPKFQNHYSCVHEAVYYHANSTVLNNRSFVTAGELNDDPCSEGSYYFVTVPGMNLFLLVIEDYLEVAGELDVNCHISNSVMKPGSFKLSYEVCPDRHQLINIPGSRSCHQNGDVSLPCGWSRATKNIELYHSLTVFLILLFCFLL